MDASPEADAAMAPAVDTSGGVAIFADHAAQSPVAMEAETSPVAAVASPVATAASPGVVSPIGLAGMASPVTAPAPSPMQAQASPVAVAVLSPVAAPSPVVAALSPVAVAAPSPMAASPAALPSPVALSPVAASPMAVAAAATPASAHALSAARRAASTLAVLSPVVVALEASAAKKPRASPGGDIFDFTLSPAGRAAVMAAVSGDAAPAVALPPPSATRDSVFGAYSPSVGLGMGALRATPTRDETLHAACAELAAVVPPADDDDTLFAFRAAPGGADADMLDGDDVAALPAARDTPPAVGQGAPASARKSERKASRAPSGPRDTTLFAWEPESNPGSAMPVPIAARPSATDDSLFASTATLDADAAARLAAALPAGIHAAAPASPNELDATQDGAAHAAALKARLAAMLAGTPPGDASLEPPSRSPTPVGALRPGGAAGGATSTFAFGGAFGAAATPAAGGQSVLRGLPTAAPPVPQPQGLPRRSMGGAALRRASVMGGAGMRRGSVAFMPQAAPTPAPAAAAPSPVLERALAPAEAAPSYAATLDALRVSWKEHVRARRSSVAAGLAYQAVPPATLQQALRLWCIAAPEAEAAEALRDAYEKEWASAASAVASGAARADAAPPRLARAAAAACVSGDDVALAALRDEAYRLQRACKDGGKARAAQLRLSAGAAHAAQLRQHLAALRDQAAQLGEARAALADVAAGVAALGVAAAAGRSAAAFSARDKAAHGVQSRATAAAAQQRRAAADALRREAVLAEGRVSAATARREQLRSALAHAAHRLATARRGAPAGPAAAADAASRRADAAAAAQAAQAALERGAEADILARCAGFSLDACSGDAVSLVLAGSLFRITTALTPSGAVATAELLPPPAGAPLRGRGAPDRAVLAAALAAPLSSAGSDARAALRPLALRCARATDIVAELDEAVAAFPQLAAVRCPGGRTVALDWVQLVPPGAALAPRKLCAAITLPEGADTQQPLADVAVRARAGAADMPTEAELAARVAAVAPGTRRLLRVCAVLHAAVFIPQEAAQQ
jgi:hypothetical protein